MNILIIVENTEMYSALLTGLVMTLIVNDITSLSWLNMPQEWATSVIECHYPASLS